MEKLIKYVSRVSTLSRRKSEELIKSGKVRINTIVMTEPSAAVTSEDSVSINNEMIQSQPMKLYIALYKPEGYISDLQDPRGRKIARDLIDIHVKLFPVGRLDYHSEGLMIFTNDGDFANEIMHPRYGIEKEYLVKMKGVLKKEEVERMIKGVVIDGEVYKLEGIQFIRTAIRNAFREKQIATTRSADAQSSSKRGNRPDLGAKNSWYRIIVNEGKNRMIRKIADAMKHPVLKLKRVRIGRLELDDLEPGRHRYFEKDEAMGSPRKKRRI
jgi:23S rRNA pseudouridine2605 synthase